MFLTSLNKIIAVLIVGSIPICWVFFRFDIYTSDKLLSSIGPVLGGLLFVVSAIACGTVIDSISDMITRKLVVARIASSKGLSRIFGHGAEYERFEQWNCISDLCLKTLDIDPRKLDEKIALAEGD